MKIPLSYNFRNLWVRKTTTLLTLLGITLVTMVFAAVLMLADGLSETLTASGSDQNAIVLRKSTTSESLSQITIEDASLISTFPEIAIDENNQPLITFDLVSVLNLSKKETGDMGNVTIRGVSEQSLKIHNQVKLAEGRWFQKGAREVVVGEDVVKNFDGIAIGKKIKIRSDDWDIVGIYDAGKTSFSSESWCDVVQFQQDYDWPIYSSATLMLRSTDDFISFKNKIEADQRLSQFQVKREKEYYAEQSSIMANFIRILGLVITIIFSFGAIIGAMITMYAAVANRTKEIGTLRALGFKRRSVLTAFLFESLLISTFGGFAGLFFASFLQTVSFSTTNFGSFSELAFGFSLTTETIISTIIFSLIMGFVGGFLPAIQASRLKIVNALRGL